MFYMIVLSILRNMKLFNIVDVKKFLSIFIVYLRLNNYGSG